MTQSLFAYDPAATVGVKEYDVDYQESWQMRIYQPEGPGPFPAVLDVHGGAWNAGSRLNSELVHRALAATGIVVAAADFRLAPDHPYPAQVADVNFATRWLKAHAGDFNADGRAVGGNGSSSGGHTIMLSATRPNDPRYSENTSADTAGFDATLAYVMLNSPVLDSYARYVYAKGAGLDRLMQSTERYFLTEDAMQEGSATLGIERGDATHLPPVLLVQGDADENVPMSIPERFTKSYKAAGGEIQLEVFPGMPHVFTREPGAETDKAIGLMKAYVARQLAVSAAAV